MEVAAKAIIVSRYGLFQACSCNYQFESKRQAGPTTHCKYARDSYRASMNEDATTGGIMEYIAREVLKRGTEYDRDH